MGTGPTLEQTPSWRVVIFLVGFLIISLIVEHTIHALDHYLHHHGKSGLRAALGKVKDELMLLGFISLVLVIVEDSVLAICAGISTTGIPVLLDKCAEKLSSSSGTSSSNSSSSSNSGSGYRRMLLGTTIIDDGCAADEAPFISQSALHQVHLLIFMYALGHIIYGCLMMAMAQNRVSKWGEWEQWAEHPDKHVEKFHAPDHIMRNRNCCIRNGQTFLEQFYKSVDPFAYAALRKFYLTTHDLPNTFDFHAHVLEGLSHDFGEVLGLRAWMWIVAAVQIIFEGYGVPALGSFLSVAITMAIGFKLQLVKDELAAHLYEHFDTDGSGSMDEGEIRNMLTVGGESEKGALESMEPTFWCGRPHLVLSLIQFCMWQNAQTLAGLLFYGTSFNGIEGSCFYINRGIPMIIVSVILCLTTFMHMGQITVPNFSLLTHMTQEKKKKKALRAERAAKAAAEHHSHVHRSLHRQHTAHLAQVYPAERGQLRSPRASRSVEDIRMQIQELEIELREKLAEQQVAEVDDLIDSMVEKPSVSRADNFKFGQPKDAGVQQDTPRAPPRPPAGPPPSESKTIAESRAPEPLA